jgi:hypothetical protein
MAHGQIETAGAFRSFSGDFIDSITRADEDHNTATSGQRVV